MKELFKLGGQPSLGKASSMIISIVGILLLVGLWQGACSMSLVPPKILPSPIEVLGSFPRLIGKDHLLMNSLYSIWLNLTSYFWALLIAIPAGFFLSCFPITNMILGRYIESIRFLPILALSGIFISIFGLTFEMKSAFLAFGLLIFVIPEVAKMVNNLQNPRNDKDNVYLQTSLTLGASSWQRFRDIYWPFVMRGVFPSIRGLLAVSWSYVCVAEYLYKDGNICGIGALINLLVRQSHIAEAYAALIVIILIGILQDQVFLWIEKLLFPSKYNLKSIWKSYYEKPQS